MTRSVDKHPRGRFRPQECRQRYDNGVHADIGQQKAALLVEAGEDGIVQLRQNDHPRQMKGIVIDGKVSCHIHRHEGHCAKRYRNENKNLIAGFFCKGKGPPEKFHESRSDGCGKAARA